MSADCYFINAINLLTYLMAFGAGFWAALIIVFLLKRKADAAARLQGKDK